jgi:hypothetical protein
MNATIHFAEARSTHTAIRYGVRRATVLAVCEPAAEPESVANWKLVH